LKNTPLCPEALRLELQESHPFNFTALLNGFKLEEVNLRQQEDKSVG